LLATVVVLAQVELAHLLSGWHSDVAPVPLAMRMLSAPSFLFFYAAWLGGGYALVYRDLHRLREVQAAEMEADYARARLRALRARPHSTYLLESLTALRRLLRSNPGGAARMLPRLADFLRLTLGRAPADPVRLGDELELARAYLDVQRAIRGDAIEVRWGVDPALLGVPVPHPALQRTVDVLTRGSSGSEISPVRLHVRTAWEEGTPRLLLDRAGGAPPLAPGESAARRERIRAELERLWSPSPSFEIDAEGPGTLRVILPLETVAGTREEGEGVGLDLGGPPASADPPGPAFDVLRSRTGWLVLLGWWTLVGILFAAMYHASAAAAGRPISVLEALGIGFVDMYLWAAVCAAAFAMVWFLPLDSANGWRVASLHLATGIAIVLSRLGLEVLLARSLGVVGAAPFTTKLLIQGPTHTIGYGLMLLAGYAIEYHRKAREKEIEAWRARALAIGARLSLLKMQLHPHFLFNSLNAIATLMMIDREEAIRTTSLLEELLRRSLDRGDRHEVALEEEIDLLRNYIEIERIRHGDHLHVEWDVAPDALGASVPHLLLQPLVENAVRHGISPLERPGRIRISARREGERLMLAVEDDGAGFDPAILQRGGGGLGLSNTRDRLACLHPGAHRLDLESGPGEGTTITITLPFRETPSRPASPPPLRLHPEAA